MQLNRFRIKGSVGFPDLGYVLVKVKSFCFFYVKTTMFFAIKIVSRAMGSALLCQRHWKVFGDTGKILQKQPLEVFCKKKMFIKNSQISQENTCVGVSF